MLRQNHGDGKISGVTDSGRFTEYDETFIFRQRDIDGVYLEPSGKSGTRSTTVFFEGHTCSIPDNDGKLYKFLRELLINRTSMEKLSFHNNPEIKP